MRQARAVLSLALLLLVAACATGDEESIDAWQAADFYIVTVGVSKLVLTIPKDDLVPDPSRAGGATDSPRYFKYKAPDDNLIVSGWFEPDRLFTGVDEIWKQRTADARKAGLPERRDVQFSKLGNWDVISYELEIRDITSTHMFAEWVQSGTWIELHLSTSSASSGPENRAKLAAFLQRIAVMER